MKNDRLFQILYLLLEKGSMTAPELAGQLEVSTRTVYRDVEVLSKAGVPIYASAGKGGGISLMPGYSFDKTLLSDEEQNQILFAVQSLQAAEQEVDQLLCKLGTTFQKPKADWITVDFSRWGMHHTDTENFELIKNAILNKQVLHLSYCGTSGEQTTRCVHPLRLVYKDKYWYLQAYCLQADDFRLFKIGRILKLIPTAETFSRDYAGDIPPIETTECPTRATRMKLRFSPRIAYRVYDEFDHSCLTREPNGTLLAEVAFSADSWVLNYLFSFGTDVEILEPADLRMRLALYAKNIAAHHKLDI